MRRFVLIGCLTCLICVTLLAVRTPALKAEETPAVKTDAGKEETPAAKADTAKEEKPVAKPEAAKEEKPAATADSDKEKAAAAETARQRIRRERHEKEEKERAEKIKKEAAETKETKKEAQVAKPTEKAEAAKPAEKTEAAKTTEKQAKKPTVVQLTLKGEYPEGPGMPGLFGEMQPSLATLVQRMDAAAADKDVSAVWLKIEDLAIGRGEDLRAARRRSPGCARPNKPVYAELTTADGRQYLLAAACDQIVMPPSRHVDHSRRAGGSHLLQGPARQARPSVRRPARWASTRAPPSRLPATR